MAGTPKWASEADARGLRHGYRSGLEEDLAAQIEGEGHPVLFETFRLPYVIPERLHHYTPDFMLPNRIIIEGKGIFDAQDRAKHLLLKAQHPELDIRFVFSRSKAYISKGSRTTLADWCNKFGFKFADRRIPREWFTEPGPKADPREIIKEVKSAAKPSRSRL